MNQATRDRYVRCSLIPGREPGKSNPWEKAEVFIVRDAEPDAPENDIEKIAHEADLLKTSGLQNISYRNKILRGYTILRSVLADRLDCDPNTITYEISGRGKPWLKGNKLYFNVSHTRTGFVFGISAGSTIGIDIEEIKPDLDFLPIIRRFFSEEETNYIIRGGRDARDRFFLLWTRKEALLKCIGTGIVENLSQVEVFRRVNLIPGDQFRVLLNNVVSDHHYIYSARYGRHFLSVAVPCRAHIEYYSIDATGHVIAVNPASCKDL